MRSRPEAESGPGKGRGVPLRGIPPPGIPFALKVVSLNLRRTVVSAALVAAVISPAALFSAAPAFADSAPTRITADSLAALEKAQNDAFKALGDANGALAGAKANYETVKNDPNQFERMWVLRVKDTAEKAAAASAAADKEAEAASLAFATAKPEDLDKARERMQAADKAANEAHAAETKAKAAVTAAEKALDDVMAGWTARIAKLEEAQKAATKAYQDANKAYADAKAAYYGQQEAEQNTKPADTKPSDTKPAETPGEKPADTQADSKPVEQPAAVTPATDSTVPAAASTASRPSVVTASAAVAPTGPKAELAETGAGPASYLALGSGLALSLGAAALYVSRRQQARSTS